MRFWKPRHGLWSFRRVSSPGRFDEGGIYHYDRDVIDTSIVRDGDLNNTLIFRADDVNDTSIVRVGDMNNPLTFRTDGVNDTSIVRGDSGNEAQI